MPKKPNEKIARIEAAMFARGRVELTPTELELKSRLEFIFTYWLDNPMITHKAMRDFVQEQFGVSNIQAMRLISYTEILLGNVRTAGKEWYRFMVVEGLKKIHDRAYEEGDWKAAAMAMDKIGKYTRLDQKEDEELNQDNIFVPEWEPSADVSVLDIEIPPDFEEKRGKLIEKYIGETEDVDFTDLDE